MSSNLQAEGLCLRFPENLPPHANFSHELAVQMLGRAISLATQVAFQPSYIDKPPDGQIYLLFIPGGVNFPLDGIRYMEHEQRYAIPLPPDAYELEVIEARHGFVPLSGEVAASRVRRRYRLIKGGHPFLVLVHYSRGQPMAVPPALQAQPVRQYPLRQHHNEPALFVLGERQGQRVPPSGPVGGMPPNVGMGVGAGRGRCGRGYGVGGRPDAQAMIAQQNREMEALERRSQRERSGSMNPAQRQLQPPQRHDEEDSAEELEHISTRTLALTRYRRNHELMNEVFIHAAFGDKQPPKPPAPYSVFEKAELENRVERLSKEIEELQTKSAARRAAREREQQGADVSMDEVGVVPSVVVA
ncbi:hypothetical protein BJV77DRAFT_1031425 [Russula vinacea]|nr:hypothetical protein BJV77DRAFT_1031425 [Russula vinacea]